MTDQAAEDIGAVARIEAIPVLLDILGRTTGAGLTAVACLTGTRWVAAALRDGLGLGLAAGGELPLEAICREVQENRRTIVIENVAADGRFCHAGPARHGFQSYISTPILRADGRFFGTLSACDRQPRLFGAPETVAMFETFAGLIAAQLNTLERDGQKAALAADPEAAALREQFIAVLGHDLRNPLTAILGGMEMLRKNRLPDRAAQWAEMVVASANRMAELIDVVVDFSRIRLTGCLLVECADCDQLEPVLRQIAARLEAARPDRLIEMHCQMTEPVHCDLKRITQLAGNLLSNAVTYGDPEQPVVLSAVSRDGWFELKVRNEGTPIPPAILARMFEPFPRGTVQPSREGLGLGLYISHQIALAHAGTLGVSSTPEETCFTFRMPLRSLEA